MKALSPELVYLLCLNAYIFYYMFLFLFRNPENFVLFSHFDATFLQLLFLLNSCLSSVMDRSLWLYGGFLLSLLFFIRELIHLIS